MERSGRAEHYRPSKHTTLDDDNTRSFMTQTCLATLCIRERTSLSRKHSKVPQALCFFHKGFSESSNAVRCQVKHWIDTTLESPWWLTYLLWTGRLIISTSWNETHTQKTNARLPKRWIANEVRSKLSCQDGVTRKVIVNSCCVFSKLASCQVRWSYTRGFFVVPSTAPRSLYRATLFKTAASAQQDRRECKQTAVDEMVAFADRQHTHACRVCVVVCTVLAFYYHSSIHLDYRAILSSLHASKQAQLHHHSATLPWDLSIYLGNGVSHKAAGFDRCSPPL